MSKIPIVKKRSQAIEGDSGGAEKKSARKK